MIITVERSSNNVHILGVDLLRAFHKLVYLQFCELSDQNTVQQRFR